MAEQTRDFPATETAPTVAPHDQLGTLTAGGDSPAAVAAGVLAPDGYELLGELGRGGMGAVFRAREVLFDRPVAVKVLHPRYTTDSPAARRFLDEARITARLQHPGVPPVHDLGTLPDGRPFLAMKLIAGRTLADLFAARPDPTHDRPRLLAAFEQVCQAVGFAHAQGVVHRDLKPDNVMVGEFGEVQVMDWGLAKEVRAADDGTRTDDSPHPATGAELTQAGSILGTPAYMAPEQARGEAVDERADVYALGTMLCELLTGQPPLAGTTKSVKELLARVATGDTAIPFARLDACGADAELVALAKSCLAAAATARPADAFAVAAALGEYRTGVEQRLRAAEVDRATAVEQARRRRLAILFLQAVAFLLIAVSGLIWWGYERNREVRDIQIRAENEKARTVAAALAEVALLRDQGLKQADDPTAWRQTLALARASYKRAAAALEQGWLDDALPRGVWAARAELDADDRDCTLLVELGRLPDQNELAMFLGELSDSRVLANRYEAVFRSAGLDLDTMTAERAAEWVRRHRFPARVIVGLREWQHALPGWQYPPDPTEAKRKREFAASIAGRLSTLLDTVTDKFGREWWRAAGEFGAHEPLRKLMGRPEFAALDSRQRSSFAAALDTYRANSDPMLAYDFLRAAHLRFPSDFWVNYRLARFLDTRPNFKPPSGDNRGEAMRYYAAAVAARPNSAFPRAMLALFLLASGRDAGSVEPLLRGAIAVDPGSAWPHMVLAGLLVQRGDTTPGVDEFVAGVRADPDTGFSLVNSFLIPLRGSNATAVQRAVYDRLVAEFPDRLEPWLLRAQHRSPYQFGRGDARGQLADLRQAVRLNPAGHPKWPPLRIQLEKLEALAVWEPRLPGILAGTDRAATAAEWARLAEYCAGFDADPARATEFAGKAVAADPAVLDDWFLTTQFANWAVAASDAKDLTEESRTALRQTALKWVTDHAFRRTKGLDSFGFNSALGGLSRFRHPKQLAQLPADEAAAWKRAFDRLLEVHTRERLPPPRPVK